MLIPVSLTRPSSVSQLKSLAKTCSGPGMKTGSTQPEADKAAQAMNGTTNPTPANSQYWARVMLAPMAHMPCVARAFDDGVDDKSDSR